MDRSSSGDRGETMRARFVPLALLLGCSTSGGEPPAGPGPAPDAGATADAQAPSSALVYLSPTDHLLLASMVLRGIRPNVRELQRVHDDPSALPAIVDQYLASPEFGVTVREMHNEALTALVQPEIFPAGFAAIGPFAGLDVTTLNLSITESPLRLVEWVVTHDRPYTEIVTADYTVADGIVAKVWGLPYDGDGVEWRVTHWPDARPAAGILADSWLFTRHSTTYSNSNRGRANAVSRALLCFDFLSRQLTVDTSINLGDPTEVAHAVKKNEGCASCHQELDPLAAYFGPFLPLYVPADNVTAYPFKTYDPSLTGAFTVADPAYFGRPGGGVDYLGHMIAEDARFSLCAAKRFYAYFNNLRVDQVPVETAAPLQRVLVTNGMKAKALARAIVLSDDFRVSHLAADDPNADANGMRKIRPGQLARTMQDLTGFVWQTRFDAEIIKGKGKVGQIDLMNESLFGFEVLAGGIDSVNVTLPSQTMNASASLVLRALAARAAPYVVEHDFATADRTARKLLTKVEPSDVEEGAIRAQLALLMLRLYGQFTDPSSPEVSDAYQLFHDVLATADARRSWTATLFAMLQDVRLAHF
jgi:hypothetical protein